ncbi:hypothetical protein ACFXHA_21690 [Nocardia sp. NPDC059240]|uniref:hypothetical protein n=1 Tax=Nocardia sp. NPDC059240 TaxID=3346786 RepID=UPI00367987A4
MSANALAAWFMQIFDPETLDLVAARLDFELAERIVCGTATVADLFLASEAVGWDLGELLPASLDELYRPIHHLDGRDIECIA